jgi:hypothetical protein
VRGAPLAPACGWVFELGPPGSFEQDHSSPVACRWPALRRGLTVDRWLCSQCCWVVVSCVGCLTCPTAGVIGDCPTSSARLIKRIQAIFHSFGNYWRNGAPRDFQTCLYCSAASLSPSLSLHSSCPTIALFSLSGRHETLSGAHRRRQRAPR